MSVDKYAHNNQTDSEEIMAAREELTRYTDHGDLPDIDMTMFESLEAYLEWIMEGRQRFSCQ